MNKLYTTLGLSAVAALASMPLSTQAASVFDDFESYAAGSSLHGQDSWVGWGGSAGATGWASTAFAYGGAQSVFINSTSDLVRTFSGVDTGPWTFSIQQYIPSTATGDPFVILMSQYTSDGNGDWNIQTHWDLSSGVITAGNGNIATTVPILKDQWVEVRCDIDFTANTFTQYYGNTLLTSGTWQDATGPMALGALDLYGNTCNGVYYDNLTVIPEPSTLALLGLGTLALALRRKNR